MASLASAKYTINENGFPTSPFYGHTRCTRSVGTDVTDNLTSEARSLNFMANSVIVMSDRYCREDERLKTFDRWPLEWLDKYQLAQTGMVYTGEEDKVKCYFCEVEIGRWEREDDPVPEHLRWSPNCPLLRRRTTNNVPLSSEALDRILPPVSYDICGGYEPIEMRPRAYTEGTTSAPTADLTSDSSSSAVSAYYPEYPEYAVESARLRSFGDWPRIMKQKPHQLAEAGFFYTNSGDRVKCFSCGGGLKDWDENDDPWEQHALWLSKCRFLKLIKGQAYIDAVIHKQKMQGAQEATAATSGDDAQQTVQGETDVIGSIEFKAHSNSNSNSNSNDAVLDTPAKRIYDKIVSASEQEPTTNELSVDLSARKLSGNGSIPEEKLCKICYASEYNTAFLPCGHVVACAKCASSVTKCPLCRKPFTDVMRVYFS